MTKKPHLRGTVEISLLEEKSEYSWRPLIPLRYNNVVDQEIFFNRVYPNLQKGRDELQKMLDEMRKIIFNKLDLINWFYKIKDDAENEVEHIFIKHEALFGGSINDVNFERIGLLSGIWEEAEKFLGIMMAIEPLDENKPHYSILDELEKMDEAYQVSNNLFGFYNVQKHPKIKIQKYQLKNLAVEWTEYIEKYKDSPHTSDGFGDVAVLIGWYHTNFNWDLYRLKPRENIKAFLDFHYNSYEGEKELFLKHIEYRTLPNVESFARTDHKMYSQLINEWLKDKKSKLSLRDTEYLLESVTSVCLTFLDNLGEYGITKLENRYNSFIRDLLKHRLNNKGWTVKDQSMGGTTLTQTKKGLPGISFRDMIIVDEKLEHLSAIECFRIKSVPKNQSTDTVINEHLIKIFKNEPIGLNPLFIVVYCESANFESSWEKYIQYISQIDFGSYQQMQLEEENLSTKANLKIAKVIHYRSAAEISIYHYFINMNP